MKGGVAETQVGRTCPWLTIQAGGRDASEQEGREAGPGRGTVMQRSQARVTQRRLKSLR